MSEAPLLHPRWDDRLRRDVAAAPVVTVTAPSGRPPRVAIISDSHGNLSALQAVLSDLEAVRPDAVVVGGDIAQGAAAPDQVIDLLRERGWPAVIGNADAFLLDVRDDLAPAHTPPPFLGIARWSITRLTGAHITFLRNLPGALRIRAAEAPEVMVVHATPWSIEEVVLRDAPEEAAARMLAAAGTPVVAYGHIHSPYRRRTGNGLVLSVGAISVSNDRDPRPAYSVLTLDHVPAVEVRRVAYDAGAAAAAIRASGAPVSEDLLRAMITGGTWDVAATVE